MNHTRACLLFSVAPLIGGCVIGNGTDGEPVEFAIGAPLPVAIAPGVVEHDVCVATTVPDGYVRSAGFDGTSSERIEPEEGAPVQDLPINGLDCPDASEGFVGWARLRWTTEGGRNVVTFGHELGPIAATATEDPGLLEAPAPHAGTSGEIRLVGERFPGYVVIDAFVDDSQPGVLGVSLDLAYGDAGPLVGVPAADVPFQLDYTPVTLELFGSTTGETPASDSDGHNTLLYNQATFCDIAAYADNGAPADIAVFVTPQDGGTELAATLAYDSYCAF